MYCLLTPLVLGCICLLFSGLPLILQLFPSQFSFLSFLPCYCPRWLFFVSLLHQFLQNSSVHGDFQKQESDMRNTVKKKGLHFVQAQKGFHTKFECSRCKQRWIIDLTNTTATVQELNELSQNPSTQDGAVFVNF